MDRLRGSAPPGCAHLEAPRPACAALLLEPVPAARASAPIALAASPTPEPDAAAPALGSALDGGAAVVAATSPVDQSAGGGQASTP